MSTLVSNASIAVDSTITQWFEKFQSEIRVDKISYETGTLEPKIQQFYTDLAYNDHSRIFPLIEQVASDYFRKEITLQFIKEIVDNRVNVTKLAVKYDFHSVLTWAEINTDDEEAENALILIKARINAKFNDKGFKISCTIVEKADQLNIPSTYGELQVDI